MTSQVKLTTRTGKLVSPITLFAQYKNGRTQTLRGDKFTDIPNEMIINLYKRAFRIMDECVIIIIYDNRLSAEAGENIVLKWYKGVLEIDRTMINYEIQNIKGFIIKTTRLSNS